MAKEEWGLGTCIAGPSSCPSCGQSGPSIAFPLFSFEQSTPPPIPQLLLSLPQGLFASAGDIFGLGVSLMREGISCTS